MTFSETDPYSMQEVFQKDLSAQLQPLRAVLEKAAQGTDSKEALELCFLLCRMTHTLMGPARLMDYQLFAELIEMLGQVSQSWTHRLSQVALAEKWMRFKDIVAQVMALFTQFVEGSPAALKVGMTQSKEQMQQLKARLEALQEEISSLDKQSPVDRDKKVEQVIPTATVSSVQVDPTILALFLVDLETHTQRIQEGLLALELNPCDEQTLASLMRSSHSIKGAARVIGLEPIVHLAHALEECFLHIHKKSLNVGSHVIQLLFNALDLLRELFKQPSENMREWLLAHKENIDSLKQKLLQLTLREPIQEEVETTQTFKQIEQTIPHIQPTRTLRMTAAYMNRLMGFAGELLVESHTLQPFAEELLQLKKMQDQQFALIDSLHSSECVFGEEEEAQLIELRRKTSECRFRLTSCLEEFESFIRRHASLSDSLYREVVDSRLCPFSEGVEELPRMVRDLAYQLHKQVRLEIIGRAVTVDRDILDKLQTPLQHLLRNAVDHGIETPEQRISLGKPAVGTIQLEAYHRAGVLNIVVVDDGRGVDLASLKKILVEKHLVDEVMVEQLREMELLHFLFLPGFSTTQEITEISGRGYGLNTVQTMVHEVGGQVHINSVPGKFMRISLQLPLTLSTLRALLVEVAGEPYAISLARSTRTVLLESSDVVWLENRRHALLDGENIALFFGHQLLGMPSSMPQDQTLSVLIVTEQTRSYGIIVDRLLGERELVIQELDPRLGKVPTISCGATMEDGSPVLVIDVEDMISAAETLIASQESSLINEASSAQPIKKAARILIVDDSITVREVECRILESAGYIVDSAVNGMDGWNLVRIQTYDLVITDIDMPRMNGLEFVQLIKSSETLKKMPVMIVSYKEGPEERLTGLQAGADAYLTKSSFQDDSFLDAVRDLLH